MEDLTFGEQVKIILGRKGMTIKQLAALIEEKTGKKMSRQNLTQRLGRDNFQEQDMRMIAEILECPFHLSIMSAEVQPPQRSTAALERAAAARTDAVARMTDRQKAVLLEAPERKEGQAEPAAEEETVQMGRTVQAEEREQADQPGERDMTIGELYEMHKELEELEENAKAGEPVEEIKKELEKPKRERFGGFFLRRKRGEENKEAPIKKEADGEEKMEAPAELAEEQKPAAQEHTDLFSGEQEESSLPSRAEEPAAAGVYGSETEAGPGEEDFEPVISHDDAEENTEEGEVNPYTGREYQSNSVRMHPTRIGYVQVYDRTIHKWTDMTEWAFLGLQERKKALLGKAYEPPVYLD